MPVVMSRNVVPRYGSGRFVRWTKDCWKEKKKKKEKGEIGHQFADARPCVLFKRGERRMWGLLGGDLSQYVTWSSRTQDLSVRPNAA